MDTAFLFQTASVAELVKLYDIFDIAFDLENSTFQVWLNNVGTGHMPYSAVKDLSNNHSKIEDIVLSCFLEKRIMWKDFRQELADDCISNLKDLSEKLEHYKNHFEQSDREEDKLLNSILLLWLMECIQAKKEFDRANFNEDPQEDDYFDNRPDVEGEIVSIIGDFRSKTIKIARLFIDLLPEDNSLRSKAEMIYYKALSELIRYYNINLNDVLDFRWELELVKK